MVYTNRPLGMNYTGVLPGTKTPVEGGVVVTNPDSTVLSVQPGGQYESRPAGTAGPYEVAQDAGAAVIYCPDGVHYYAVGVF